MRTKTLLAILSLWLWSLPIYAAPDIYKYVGNSFSLKFHRPSCPFALQIWPDRVRLFHFRYQAVEAGYKPCHWCLPPVWLRVHAVLRLPATPANSVKPAMPPVPASSSTLRP